MGAARGARRGLYMVATVLLAGFILAGIIGTRMASLENVRTDAGRTPILFSDPTSASAPIATTTTAAERTDTTQASTTTMAPSTTIRPAPVIRRGPALASPRQVASGPATGSGCGPALAYLQANANPAARIECPAWAGGHQAETCYHDPPICGPTEFVIRIWDPCPAAYMNEAWNSNHFNGPFDPYGYCR